jgi:peroxiredoxin
MSFGNTERSAIVPSFVSGIVKIERFACPQIRLTEGSVRRFAFPVLALGVFFAPAVAADPPPPVGTRVADFTLTEPATGQPWSLVEKTRGAKATVILFVANDCPACTAYSQRLKELHRRYSRDGVVFVAINSMESDDANSVTQHVKNFEVPYPVLKDNGTALADRLAVERVPTALVLDATRTVRYTGRIDDQYAPGVHRTKATTRELGNAIDSLLEQREIQVPHAPAAGCLITRERQPQSANGDPVTYHKHVARVIQSKCLECHRRGEAGPFTLNSYRAAKGWADMIREVVADNIMPPWHADAPYGHFKNDRRLTPDEKQTILDWIDQGCIEGDPADAPPPPQFVEGWRLPREPDEIIRMNKPVQIPATSLLGLGMPYQYVEAGEPFTEDKWVTDIEVRPEYRAVVHHIIAFVVPPGGTIFDVAGDQFGRHLLGAYVPGDQPVIGRPGMARKIAKGSRLVFEMHYTPNGIAGTDQSMIGLCYAKEPPEKEVHSEAVFNGRFRIPPGADNYEVQAVHVFPEESTILSLTPHMHLRGKAFRYELVTTGPDGSEQREVLLNVPKYDFNWQVSYEFAEPRVIPAGSKLVCTAWYDNSAKNPFNPDPTKTVRWGNQTWEEMMIGFVMYHVGK